MLKTHAQIKKRIFRHQQVDAYTCSGAGHEGVQYLLHKHVGTCRKGLDDYILKYAIPFNARRLRADASVIQRMWLYI